MTKRVAILISGGGSNMEALVKAMTGDFPARAVLVLSDTPEAVGLDKARALHVPCVAIDRRAFGTDRVAFETAVTAALDASEPDVICLAGFMRVLSAEFVGNWPGQILNIHPSLLPKYRGLHTHARALEAGDAQAGCSVHVVTAELDAGHVLGQARVAVEPGDTADALAARVLVAEHQLYPDVLRRFCSGIGAR